VIDNFGQSTSVTNAMAQMDAIGEHGLSDKEFGNDNRNADNNNAASSPEN
jgi:hypothetical protein